MACVFPLVFVSVSDVSTNLSENTPLCLVNVGSVTADQLTAEIDVLGSSTLKECIVEYHYAPQPQLAGTDGGSEHRRGMSAED